MKTILVLLISGSLMITPAKAETIACKKQGDIVDVVIITSLAVYWLFGLLAAYGKEIRHQDELKKAKDQCGDKQ